MSTDPRPLEAAYYAECAKVNQKVDEAIAELRALEKKLRKTPTARLQAKKLKPKSD